MKKIDISRLEHWRPINLRIGFAVSLALMVLAFSWTAERPPLEDPYEDFVEIGEVEIIPPTTHPKKKELPPPPKALPTDFEIMPDPVPFEPFEPSIVEPIEPEPGVVYTEPARQPFAPVPAFEPPKAPEEELPFIIVEEMPRFPGCEEEGLSKKEKAACAETKLLRFLADQLTYPNIARANGIEGMVVVTFVVEKDGSISNAKVLRDIGGGCGAAALQVAQSMPDWIPGKQRGRAVRVQYNLPVRFRLH